MQWSILAIAFVVASAAAEHGCSKSALPDLVVTPCDDANGRATAVINSRLGTLAADFPPATVELCYTAKSLELTFEAQQEASYLVNSSFVNNDPLWMWTVMEAFISTGDHDPTQYLEFEVAPNNRIWTGFIHNPNKDFTSKATAFIDDWGTYPITSSTTHNLDLQTWKSTVSLPLTMWNVESPEGTEWRMNFFRTYYENEDSEQEYGAWNPNKLISFHQTPCFGRVQLSGGDYGPNAVAQSAVGPHGCSAESLPTLTVPHCRHGHRATAIIDKRLGTLAADFPKTSVQLCFTDKALELEFEAQGETSYLVNETQANNDPIWMWTVMEAFIALGDNDPTEYLEFEVAPNNRIWTGYIHNPNKDFTSKATAFIDDWDTYPITSSTTRNEAKQTWKSTVSLPLTMFNVETPEGTEWRMNFFRTYFRDASSEQEYGAWNPNKLISFHQTPCFGRVQFEGGKGTHHHTHGSSTDEDKANETTAIAFVVLIFVVFAGLCVGNWFMERESKT